MVIWDATKAEDQKLGPTILDLFRFFSIPAEMRRLRASRKRKRKLRLAFI